MRRRTLAAVLAVLISSARAADYRLTSATLPNNAQPITSERTDVPNMPPGTTIPPDAGNPYFQGYLQWLADGNTPDPAPAIPTPVPTALLWQLEAICNDPPPSLGFTPPTWAQVQAAVAAQKNAVLTAFFNVGTNPIPANSTTLSALATGFGLTQPQLTALVAAASQISIP